MVGMVEVGGGVGAVNQHSEERKTIILNTFVPDLRHLNANKGVFFFFSFFLFSPFSSDTRPVWLKSSVKKKIYKMVNVLLNFTLMELN